MSRAAKVALTRQLDELLSGAWPVDDCPSDAVSLLPIAAAVRLDDADHLSPLDLERGRRELLAAIAAGSRTPVQERPSLPSWLCKPALAGGLALALSGSAVAYAAQGAPPDSPLYRVHQATEVVSRHVPFLQPTAPAPTIVPTREAPPVVSPSASASPAGSSGAALRGKPAAPPAPRHASAPAAKPLPAMPRVASPTSKGEAHRSEPAAGRQRHARAATTNGSARSDQRRHYVEAPSNPPPAPSHGLASLDAAPTISGAKPHPGSSHAAEHGNPQAPGHSPAH